MTISHSDAAFDTEKKVKVMRIIRWLMKCYQSYRFTRKRNRHLAALNKANMFQKIQEQAMTADQIRAKRKKQRLEEEAGHRRQEWRDSAVVIDLHESAPDGPEGRAFLDSLGSADLHIVALAGPQLSRYAEQWVMSFATHPRCDLGTAWELLLSGSSPMEYEKYLRERSPKHELFDSDKFIISFYDMIVERMGNRDFQTRNFAPKEPNLIRDYRVAMRNSIADGHSLRWHIPDDAFNGLKGFDAKSGLEVSGDLVLEKFEAWLANN